MGIGGLAKGRSASRLLNQELGTQVPDLIGHDHYPGYLFTPTRLNSADHPTRGRAVSPPDASRPQWWDQVPRGECELFDAFTVFTRLRPQRRAYAEWVRLTLRLCLKFSVGFPWALDFDKTLGFPGEGPRPQKFLLSDRPALDFVGTRGLPAGTPSRRQLCVLQFVN